MSINCMWLPKRILLPNGDWNKYTEYEDNLYRIFLSEIYKNVRDYHGKPVHMRREPEREGRVELFYHIICDKDIKANIFAPNLERASRLRWGKAIIEHDPCKKNTCDCSGLLSWDTFEDKRHIHKILFKEKKYIVILEERADYFLYITSYYIENSQRLRKFVKEYHENKTKNALQA